MPRPSKYNCDKTNEFINRHMDIVNERKKGYIKYLLQLMEEEEGFKITNVALYRRLRKMRGEEKKEKKGENVANEEEETKNEEEVKKPLSGDGPFGPEARSAESVAHEEETKNENLVKIEIEFDDKVDDKK